MCLGREETFKRNTSVLNLRPSPLYLPTTPPPSLSPCPHTQRPPPLPPAHRKVGREEQAVSRAEKDRAKGEDRAAGQTLRAAPYLGWAEGRENASGEQCQEPGKREEQRDSEFQHLPS